MLAVAAGLMGVVGCGASGSGASGSGASGPGAGVAREKERIVQSGQQTGENAGERFGQRSGMIDRTIELGRVGTDGPRTWRYVVYVPPGLAEQMSANASGAKRWPMIVFLHGRGESGVDGRLQTKHFGTAILKNPERWPFVVVMAQKPAFDVLWPAYEAAVLAMVEATRRELPIDDQRVYLTGLSQGGHGTWSLASAHPEMFAAIAPICGFGVPGEIGPRVARLPIWAFHGGRDGVIPESRSRTIVEAVRSEQAKLGASGVAKIEPVKYTVYPEADHNSWDAAYAEDLGAWFLKFTRRGASEDGAGRETGVAR
jgi:predicted peptidase